MKLPNYLNKSSESVGGRGVETDGYRMFFTRSRFFINLLSANCERGRASSLLPSCSLRLPVTRWRDLSPGNEVK